MSILMERASLICLADCANVMDADDDSAAPSSSVAKPAPNSKDSHSPSTTVAMQSNLNHHSLHRASTAPAPAPVLNPYRKAQAKQSPSPASGHKTEPTPVDQSTHISKSNGAPDSVRNSRSAQPAVDQNNQASTSDGASVTSSRSVQFSDQVQVEGDSQQWQLAGSKSKTAPAQLASAKAHILGVKVVKTGASYQTRFDPGDLTLFFGIVSIIDPDAVILNHAKELSSAVHVKVMAKKESRDFKSFMDIKTSPRGGPSERMECTQWLCYVASDVLAPDLQQLRSNSHIRNG